MASGRPRSATPPRPASIASGQSVGALVAQIAGRLGQGRADIDDPVREARDLVAALLDVPRHWPILRENKWVEPGVWQRALHATEKRASGAPLAYAVGKADFRSLTLHVDERVLIPRPETELIVDLVLARAPRGGTVVDVGTGSGAIAIALATEGYFDRIVATDISADALAVAKANADRIGANVEFQAGDLLAAFVDGSGAPLNAVVSNPPYIAFDEARELPWSVRDWEPPTALYSPRDGLATTARLVRQAATRLAPHGLLAIEVDARRASLVAEMISADGRYDAVSVELDLAGRERYVLAKRGLSV